MRRTASWIGPWLLAALCALGAFVGGCAHLLQDAKQVAIDCSKPAIQMALTDAENEINPQLGQEDFSAAVEGDLKTMGVDLVACALQDIAGLASGVRLTAEPSAEAVRASVLIRDHGWKFQPPAR